MAARLRGATNTYDWDFIGLRGARSNGVSGHSKHTRKQRAVTRVSGDCSGMRKTLKRSASKTARREQKEWLQTANLLQLEDAHGREDYSLDWGTLVAQDRAARKADEIELAWEMLEHGELPYGVTLHTPRGKSKVFPSESEAIAHVLSLYPAAKVSEKDGFTIIDPRFRYNPSFRFTIAS